MRLLCKIALALGLLGAPWSIAVAQTPEDARDLADTMASSYSELRRREVRAQAESGLAALDDEVRRQEPTLPVRRCRLSRKTSRS